jgi:hypothetical protein
MDDPVNQPEPPAKRLRKKKPRLSLCSRIDMTSSLAHFSYAVVLGLVAWSVAWLFMIAGQLGNAHADNVWVKGAYAHKVAVARQYRGQKKTLVVGGSASMFGVDSTQLAQGLGVPAVNLGVNAGLGTYEIPRLIDPLIEAGDIVLMPLEYRLLLWDGVPSYVTLSWALEHPEAIKRWSTKTLLSALSRLSLNRVVQGYVGFDASRPPSGPYGAHRLNDLGDQTHSALADRSASQAAAVSELPPERYQQLYSHTTLGLDEWQYWWQRWQVRGACLVVVPPPFLFVNEYASPSYAAFFDGIPTRVRERGVAYLGRPQDGFFSAKAMFDTNYHLAAEGRAVYTSRLLEALRSSQIGCLPGELQRKISQRY